MEIKELKIEGFKSLGSIQLNDLNPFTVFVGPNGAGKSNIFEALEFWATCNSTFVTEVLKSFGGLDETANIDSKKIDFYADLNTNQPNLTIEINYINNKPLLSGYGRYRDHLKWNTDDNFRNKIVSDLNAFKDKESTQRLDELAYLYSQEEKKDTQFFNFSRLFVDKNKIVKRVIQDDSKLASDASNLEKVLKRILKNEIYKAEIEEILQLLIPGFDRIDVVTEELSGSDNLVVYEQSLKKPLTKRLISDGTYNIIALITAIYQSEEPQFLCIEEPENGLNPKVVKELVTIFRQKCQEKGHFIWLNTHSQTLVSELSTDEIVLVDKVDGLTQVKQIKGMNLHSMKMDEALMTNALGGGIPW